jgi:hypothetical protein
LLGGREAAAQSGRVIATPSQRARLRTVPIVQRPNRPLHFYGNTVRRVYHTRVFRGRRR